MTGSETHETKRWRVRRLLIDPLIADGFRKRQATAEAQHHDFLDRVADGLSYMSDEGLRCLRQSLASKGEGSARAFWPCYATIIGWAEFLERRPLEELPELLRWFASRAGPEALAAGHHVAEYEFWKKYKRPPAMPGEREKVVKAAAEWNARAERFREEIARLGHTRWPQDQQWLDWYESQGDYVRGLIEGGVTA